MARFWINLLAFLAGFAPVPGVIGQTIPPPTGQYNVGVKKLEIPYVNTEDPIAPNNFTVSFLATVFYPTLQALQQIPEPYLDPAVATIYENGLNMTNGSLHSLTSTLIRDAPALNGPLFPTLIFGPGEGGPPVDVYTVVLSDLASYGYTVIGVDHPYEQPFVRYPNGTGLYGLNITYDFTTNATIAMQNIRIKETIALIDRIQIVEKELGVPVDTIRIGAFGHSLGGAAALGSQLKDGRIGAGIDIDGSFWGDLAANDSSVDTKRPVFLLGSQGHGAAGTRDLSWVTFPAEQTGWWRLLNTNGSRHLDYSDWTVWKELAGLNLSSMGPIDGFRMTNITRTFVRDFFDLAFLDEPESVFNGPSAPWPEVVFVGGENITA